LKFNGRISQIQSPAAFLQMAPPFTLLPRGALRYHILTNCARLEIDK